MITHLIFAHVPTKICFILVCVWEREKKQKKFSDSSSANFTEWKFLKIFSIQDQNSLIQDFKI